MSTIFVFEMILKIIGLGMREYLKNGLNVFDCLITLLGMIDFIIGKSFNFRNLFRHEQCYHQGLQSAQNHQTAPVLPIHQSDHQDVPELFREFHQYP